MTFFNKASLELLRQQIDLVDLLSTHISLKKTGSVYKGLCPFHDEKTPSFMVSKGDTHYHCFGCGAHGDAIKFLMTHQKLSFTESVVLLAEKYHVLLERAEDKKDDNAGLSRLILESTLEAAADFYHFCLLYTEEGRSVLQYLFERQIDLDFICRFKIGWSPSKSGIFKEVMNKKKISDQALIETGLIQEKKEGKPREFFNERIMFPICNYTGRVIGFSGRKIRDEVFGGKYINTQETALFKKSRVLFGLNHSRKRIAKEKRAIIVEGQIDALRLIQDGFDLTVAGQGTAFGEGHMKELLNLGVTHVFLAMDGDAAGQEANYKIGQLFQKAGVEVQVVNLPLGSDPDSFLKNEGASAFEKLLLSTSDYLSFLIKHLGREVNLNSPAEKNQLIQTIVKNIRDWDHPVMIHEALRRLSQKMQIPESIVGVGQDPLPQLYVRKTAAIGQTGVINPDRILEIDLLRWMLLLGSEKPALIELIRLNLNQNSFKVPICSKIFDFFMSNYLNEKPTDLLSLTIELDEMEVQKVISELESKKINRERADQGISEAILAIQNRNWMQAREEISNQIRNGGFSDEENLGLLRQFDTLKKSVPQLIPIGGQR